MREKIVNLMADTVMNTANEHAREPDEFCTWAMAHPAASAALTALEAAIPGLKGLIEGTHAVAEKQNTDWACLSPEEQKEQGSRCGCWGADDYCVCQNVPDKKTLEARKAMIAAAEDAP